MIVDRIGKSVSRSANLPRQSLSRKCLLLTHTNLATAMRCPYISGVWACPVSPSAEKHRINGRVLHLCRKRGKRHMKIGLLENNPATQEWMAAALELLGHRVYIHTTGASLLEALSPVSETTLLPYDLTIIDLNLPNGISGQEVVMRIRSTAPTERLPILLISDISEHEIAHVKARFPSIPILHKPFRLQALIRSIDQYARTTLTDGSMS